MTFLTIQIYLNLFKFIAIFLSIKMFLLLAFHLKAFDLRLVTFKLNNYALNGKFKDLSISEWQLKNALNKLPKFNDTPHVDHSKCKIAYVQQCNAKIWDIAMQSPHDVKQKLLRNRATLPQCVIYKMHF